MQIVQVILKNFRCFEDATIDITKCHAIVGENGVGKTTILEAINIATTPNQTHLNEQDFNIKDCGDIQIEVIFDSAFLIKIPDGYASQSIPCKSVCFIGKRRSRATPGRAFSDPFVTEKFAVPMTYNDLDIVEGIDKYKDQIPTKVEKTASGYSSSRKTPGKKDFQFTQLQLSMQGELVDYPNIFYFDRDRESECRVGFNSTMSKVVKDLNWKYRTKWSQENIVSKWQDFYTEVVSTVENSKSSRIVEPIKSKLTSLTGNDYPGLEISLLDIEQPFSKSFFSNRDGTNQVDQSNFGSGISILLSYALLETVSKLSKEDLILLIDEPELHLHPQLQANLFSDLKNSNLQTIYTTQSDSFVDIAEWRSVTRVSTVYKSAPTMESLAEYLEGIKITDHLDEIKTWHQHQCIFFKEDNQLFFANKCVLVEGPAEKYGIPILVKLLGLELKNITILSCNGKSKIPYYQLLCKSFNIPYYTLYDKDGLDDEDTTNKRILSWALADCYKGLATSFENLFGLDSDTEHKASELLVMLDGLTQTDIPSEIKEVVQNICTWSVN